MTTDAAPKKARRGKVTRDKIIEVAESLIARHGPDGFQLQNVTELLGITPPAIYNHFKDREDLVAQVAEKGGRMLDERMRRRSGERILSSLRRNAREYVAFLAENPAHARIILWDMARQGTSGWRGLATSNIQIRTRMNAAFEFAIERGHRGSTCCSRQGFSAKACRADGGRSCPGRFGSDVLRHAPGGGATPCGAIRHRVAGRSRFHRPQPAYVGYLARRQPHRLRRRQGVVAP